MNHFIPKTDGIEGTGPVKRTGEPVKKPVKSDPDAFRRTLSEQLGANEKTVVPNAPGRLPEIQSPVKIPSTNFFVGTQQYTEEIEASLELLETYASALSDPKKTLRYAGSVLDEILKKTALLSSGIEESPPEDPDLLRILKQIISTAGTEKIKFDRGDYTG